MFSFLFFTPKEQAVVQTPTIEEPSEDKTEETSEVQTSETEEAPTKTEEAPKISFKMKEKPKLVEDWSNDNSREAFELNEEEQKGLPTMKPLPDEQEFGKDMVLSVALEQETKRRSKKRKKEEEAEDLDDEDDDSNDVEDNNIYSLDELTKIKSVEQEEKAGKAGPSGKFKAGVKSGVLLDWCIKLHIMGN